MLAFHYLPIFTILTHSVHTPVLPLCAFSSKSLCSETLPSPSPTDSRSASRRQSGNEPTENGDYKRDDMKDNKRTGGKGDYRNDTIKDDRGIEGNKARNTGQKGAPGIVYHLGHKYGNS